VDGIVQLLADWLPDQCLQKTSSKISGPVIVNDLFFGKGEKHSQHRALKRLLETKGFRGSPVLATYLSEVMRNRTEANQQLRKKIYISLDPQLSDLPTEGGNSNELSILTLWREPSSNLSMLVMLAGAGSLNS